MSKKQIVKSASIIGGSQVISILIGLLRVKVLAVLLGPAGIGLYGLFYSLTQSVRTISGMGVGSSSVRQIAEARGQKNNEKIANIRFMLRWLTLGLASLGALVLIVFSQQISTGLMGGPEYFVEVRILAIAVFFMVIKTSLAGLLQGYRRIGDLARTTILGAVWGTIIALVLVYFLREEGIAPLIATAAGVNCLLAWWYSRKIPRADVSLSVGEAVSQGIIILKLGSVFMVRGAAVVLTGLFVRYLLVEEINLEAVGYFSAAWAIVMQYTSLILNAMGKDFYPRLTEIHNDHPAVVNLVNDQMEIALILAGPVLLGMLTFAPLAVYLLYTSEFVLHTTPILQMMIIGTLFRVVTFPLGYIVLAKGIIRLSLYFGLFWNFLFVIFIVSGLEAVGLQMIGIAYVVAYILYAQVVYLVVKRVVGYRMNDKCKLLIAILALSILSIYLAGQYNWWAAYLVGVSITIAFSAYTFKSMHQIMGVTPWEYLGRRFKRGKGMKNG